ncbi:MAG: hypothetical protein KF749_07040 [Bacteroidetes bacterium]|nr:hypothetical protein [Bacteroidota bacterium]MCW5896527.1 hypothetical protein [Bacteroidota bacterium]
MSLNKIPINEKGGTVTVEISFGYAQVGAYTLLLWNKTGNSNKKLGEGINTDNVPDEFDLPKPVKNNVGKILDCLATIISPNPDEGSRYRVDMIVLQNGEECGRESYEGTISTKSVSIRLAAQLSAS